MSAHLPLMVWLSPSFPVGAFAYSHGLEWAFEAGDLHDAETLRDWLDALVRHGSLHNDLILFAAAFHAAQEKDTGALREVAELALALANSAERRLETVTQGNAFAAAVKASWPCEAIDRLGETWDGDVAYPVAVAVASAGHALPLPACLEAYGLAFVANLVSASVRLGIVGQTDGQRVTAGLVPALHEAAAGAERATLDDLGGCVLRSDIASLRHETQYSRLFRS
ncbi:urease accessory protein UreF [Bosea sp. SSUT16]|uniref:Urease accessory protein UreF n=1 Tax=Bosea spartocytisi TaxID=2773451 RepID=A0A927E467_9HYPH|nr:urease accessory protein UreF [Bosea spartocytisi]MBD3844503.1 urease accessory protein UreF [Bosea spartocytisi]MCT4470390.1 urease accessory protein UreF [Bosea spartocytisi]